MGTTAAFQVDHRQCSGPPRFRSYSIDITNTMKIETRVALSKTCRVLLFATFMAITSSFDVHQLVAQASDDGWRRTNRGWEYAHSIPFNTKSKVFMAASHIQVANNTNTQWHRVVLPVAIFSFIVSFSYWSLVEVKNRGIIRRLR